jgi:hypothetical protein
MYLVTGRGGSGMPFISSLILQLIDPSKSDFSFSWTGHLPATNSELVSNPSLQVDYSTMPEDFVHVIIRFTNAREFFLIEANHFYEITWDYNSTDTMYWRLYNEMCELNYPIRKNIQKPKDFTQDEISQVCKYNVDLTLNETGARQYLVDTVPEQYKKNIVTIYVDDILSNKEKVISQLEKITGKNRTVELENNYDQYVTLKNDLYKKYIKELTDIL